MTKRTGPAEKRRIPLDRERVLRAAIDLADTGGLEALSMRRLGRALGVEAMSLYNHVSGKDEILDGIVDLIVGDIDVAESAVDWKTAMRQRAISMRKTFVRHPWALGLMESRRSAGPATLRYFNAVLDVLRRADFSAVLAVRAFSILDSYAYGYILQEKNLPSGSGTESREATQQFLSQLPAEEYPRLAEAAVDVMMTSGFDYAKEYELGLDLILEALESRRGKKSRVRI